MTADPIRNAEALPHDETRLVIQPGPVSSLFNYGPLTNIPAAITLQPTSPFYPHAIAADAGIDGEPLDVWYRTFDNGFRDTTDTNENWQLIGGLKGTWRGFDWYGSLFYAGARTLHAADRALPVHIEQNEPVRCAAQARIEHVGHAVAAAGPAGA